MTPAQTIVTRHRHGPAYVYFNTGFAYKVENPREYFWEDVRNWCVVARKDARKYEEAPNQ